MKTQAEKKISAALITGVLMVTALTGTVAASPLTIGGEFETKLEMADSNSLSGLNQLKLNFGKSLGAASLHADVSLKDAFAGTEEALSLELGEAYLDYFAPDYDLRVGRQVITWGTALQINPTDVINPLNIADPMGDKLPVTAVLGTYYPNSFLEITGVYVPVFKPAVTQVPMPGITVNRPEAISENSEYAVKAKLIGVGGADFSVSYFTGKEDAPTLVNPIVGEAGYRDQDIFGADFATAIGDVGLWAEASLAQTEGIDDDYLSWIAGGDYRFSNGLYLAAQYAHMNKGQGETNLLIGAVERSFGGIHQWKMGSLYNVDSGSYVLMPEVTFSLADSTNLVFGAKVVADETNSLVQLGQTSNQISAEIKMSF